MTRDADERAALVALLRRSGPPTPELVDRVETEGARSVLAAQLGGDSLLPEDPGPLLGDAARELAGWERDGLCPLTVLDDHYPVSLRTVHDRPAIVFVAGDLALAGARDGVAIVGTRRPSPAGLARAERFAAELADAGHPVISGLATGIDTAAHRGTIAAGGRTIAVIGSGLAHAYPPGNRALQAELAREHAVLSPFWPATRPSAENFRRRNGVMSALARGTVIIEASPRSGTRVQARLALAHGRRVFLHTSLLRQSWASELATRPGVHVVETPEAVLTTLAGLRGPLTGPTE